MTAVRTLLLLAVVLALGCTATSVVLPPDPKLAAIKSGKVRSKNVPNYSPTSVILNGNAIDVLMQNIVNVVNTFLQPLNIAPWSSSSGCGDKYGWTSASVDINNLNSPSITILDNGVQLDISLDLALSFSVFDTTEFDIFGWCLKLHCSGGGSSAGSIGLSVIITLGVENEYLGVSLGSPVVAVPSDFHSSLSLGGFFCFLAQDIGRLFGIHLSTILNDVITGLLSSQDFSNAITAVVSSNIQAYSANNGASDQIRLCAVSFDSELSRVMLTVPINGSDGWYCSDGQSNSGPPPWGQFNCPLQDLMVIMSLQQYNYFNSNLNGIASVGKAILGDLIYLAPASVSAEIVDSSLQVCATTQTSTKEEFLGISLALQPMP